MQSIEIKKVIKTNWL